MPAIVDIKKLIEPVEAAIHASYKRGFDEGYQAALDTFMATAQNLRGKSEGVDAATPAGASHQSLKQAHDDGGDDAKRAPRGSLDPILSDVLRAKPGMATPEVEQAVLSVDDRIAIKSVYNRLRYWEKQGRKFRRNKDRLWYRVEDLPAPWAATSSPQGETGAVAAPASSTVHG